MSISFSFFTPGKKTGIGDFSTSKRERTHNMLKDMVFENSADTYHQRCAVHSDAVLFYACGLLLL